MNQCATFGYHWEALSGATRIDLYDEISQSEVRIMAQILLHGTLHVTIYEIDRLQRGSGGPKIFRK
ncbi:Hydrolyzes glycerol-phospholipids at the terminal phosphodiesteric bond, partial [Sarracenia purpurea var. burkii]